MIKLIVIKYLKNLVNKLGFEEECLEIHQDTIDNVNEVWQQKRETKESIKKVIKYLEYLG